MAGHSGRGGRLRVLLVAPRDEHQGGITRAIDSWMQCGLDREVDATIVGVASWDASLPVQLAQTARAIARVARTCARSSTRPDVVHLHVSTGGSLYRKWLIGRVAALFGVAVVVHLHSGGFQSWVAEHRLGRLVARRLFSTAAATIVLAETWVPLVRELGAHEVHVVPHMVSPVLLERLRDDTASPHQAGAPAQATATILYYGRWAPIKGADVLAEAVRSLPESQRRRLRLRLFGNGNEEWLQRCFEGVGPAEVTIHGWLEDDDKPGELAAADAVVVPSRAEAFGASLLEVMAAGTPLITTDAGAIPEVVDGYRFARVTRRGDSEELADSLAAVVEGSWPSARPGTPQLPSRFSPEAVLDGLVYAYVDAVS